MSKTEEAFFVGILVIVIISAMINIIAGAYSTLARFFKWCDRAKARRDRKLYKAMRVELRKFGKLLVANEKNKVIIMTTMTHLQWALGRRNHVIASNPTEEWKKGAIMTSNSFIFTTSEEFVSGVHTGTVGEMQDLLTRLMYNLLGGKYSFDLVERMSQSLSRTIVKMDDRLYVPFTEARWVPRWDTYKGKTLGEAEQVLLSGIIEYVRPD
ncbi:MAG: hypothetical protein WCK48_01180 [bacterium]